MAKSLLALAFAAAALVLGAPCDAPPVRDAQTAQTVAEAKADMDKNIQQLQTLHEQFVAVRHTVMDSYLKESYWTTDEYFEPAMRNLMYWGDDTWMVQLRDRVVLSDVKVLLEEVIHVGKKHYELKKKYADLGVDLFVKLDAENKAEAKPERMEMVKAVVTKKGWTKKVLDEERLANIRLYAKNKAIYKAKAEAKAKAKADLKQYAKQLETLHDKFLLLGDTYRKIDPYLSDVHFRPALEHLIWGYDAWMVDLYNQVWLDDGKDIVEEVIQVGNKYHDLWKKYKERYRPWE